MTALSDTKILVTGGAGFFGSNVIEMLLKNGVSHRNIFAPRSKECDLRRSADCEKAVAGRDFVIHAAAITGNAIFHERNPAEIFYGNAMMGMELMEASRKAGVKKFVTIGSATEYPDNAPLPFREEDLWVGAVEPLHAPYTIAKKMLLVQGQAYRKQYDFHAIHLLLTGMYGPREHEDGGPVPSFIKRMYEAKKGNRSFIEAWGTGTPTRDLLYVEDAAEAVLLAIQRYDSPEPMNIGSGHETPISALAALVAHIMGFRGEIHWDKTKPDGQPRRLLDTTRAEQEIGFRAKTGLEEGLRKTIEWYIKENA